MVRLLFGTGGEAGVSAPHLVSATTAVGLEAVMTLLLAAVILGTTERARVVGPDAAPAVGATIALCGLIALRAEGVSMNPARSLGPALVAGRLGDAWIYLAGPCAGAVMAAAVSSVLHGRAPDDGPARDAARGA